MSETIQRKLHSASLGGSDPSAARFLPEPQKRLGRAAALALPRQAGRRRILAPDGGEIVPTNKPEPDGTLLKVLARWQKLMDESVHISVTEIMGEPDM